MHCQEHGTGDPSGIGYRENHRRRFEGRSGPTDGPEAGGRSDRAGRSGPPPGETAGQFEEESGRQPRSGQDGWSTNKKAVFVGGAAVCLGAFLPWIGGQVMGTSVSVSGVQGGDGIITLGATLVSLALAAWRWNRYSKALVFAVGTLTALLMVGYIGDPLLGVDLSQYGPQQRQAVRRLFSAKIGIYVTLVGSALMVGGVLRGYLT